MEEIDLMRFLSAFALVIALMGLLWVALKKLGLNGTTPFQHGKNRRLKIVEILPIDVRHKAVLLRRDNKDHLVILGPNGETVVEDSIPVQEEKNDV